MLVPTVPTVLQKQKNEVFKVFESRRGTATCTEGIRILDKPFPVETPKYGKVVEDHRVLHKDSTLPLCNICAYYHRLLCF